MSTDEIHRCSICGKPTYFSYRFYTTKPRLETDQGLYEIGCSECGEYRIAATAEGAMTRQTPLHRATVVRLIQAANARGNRYCLNDGREVSLNSVATPGSMATIPGTRSRPGAPATASKPSGRISLITSALGTPPMGTSVISPTPLGTPPVSAPAVSGPTLPTPAPSQTQERH